MQAAQWVPFVANSRCSLAKIKLLDNLIHSTLILMGKTTLDIPYACITTRLGAKKTGFIELVVQ